jgi:hypothetical protein
MGVFSTFRSAEESLKAIGFKPAKKNAALSSQEIEDYANIAYFLSDINRFKGYLESVSADLWDRYRHLAPGESNKFTKILGSMALDRGFMLQPGQTLATPPDRIVLVAGDDPKFGSYVRNRLFWKDSMDSRHGEHSHSLQWLTIAYAEITRNSAADLYARTVDYKCVNSDRQEIYLWSWLVDCFPRDMKKFAVKLPGSDAETLESDSFRAPQYLMDYLLFGARNELKENFVAQYLYWRYHNRKWLTLKTVQHPETYEKSTQVSNIQARDIKAHGRTRHESGDEWSANKNPQTGNVVSYRQPGGKSSPHKGAPSMSIEAVFHGKPGTLDFYYIE